MTNELLGKVLHPNTFWGSKDLSAEEKQLLFSVFAEKGFTSSTFYLRFFQKGFSEWEILGVEKCKKQFLELNGVVKSLSEYTDENDPDALQGDKGYFSMLAQSDKQGVFYSCLKKAKRGLCKRFITFMGERGMSAATVTKRFSTDDTWKLWEKEGIATILEQFKS